MRTSTRPSTPSSKFQAAPDCLRRHVTRRSLRDLSLNASSSAPRAANASASAILIAGHGDTLHRFAPGLGTTSACCGQSHSLSERCARIQTRSRQLPLPGSAPGRIRTCDLRIRRPTRTERCAQQEVRRSLAERHERELSVVRSETSASRGRQPGSRGCAPQGSGGMRPSAARRRMRASNMSAVSTQSAKPAWRAAIVLLTNGERPVSAITTSA